MREHERVASTSTRRRSTSGGRNAGSGDGVAHHNFFVAHPPPKLPPDPRPRPPPPSTPPPPRHSSFLYSPSHIAAYRIKVLVCILTGSADTPPATSAASVQCQVAREAGLGSSLSGAPYSPGPRGQPSGRASPKASGGPFPLSVKVPK
jgi:hypothetical protein